MRCFYQDRLGTNIGKALKKVTATDLGGEAAHTLGGVLDVALLHLAHRGPDHRQLLMVARNEKRKNGRGFLRAHSFLVFVFVPSLSWQLIGVQHRNLEQEKASKKQNHRIVSASLDDVFTASKALCSPFEMSSSTKRFSMYSMTWVGISWTHIYIYVYI